MFVDTAYCCDCHLVDEIKPKIGFYVFHSFIHSYFVLLCSTIEIVYTHNMTFISLFIFEIPAPDITTSIK